MKLVDIFEAKFGTTDPIEICKKLAADTVKAARKVVRQTAVRLQDIKIGTEKSIRLSRWEVRQIWNRYHHYHPDAVDNLFQAIFRVA